MTRSIDWVREIAVPAVFSLAAMGASWAFSDGVSVPIYIFFMSAVLASAYLARWRAGVVATVISAICSVFFLVPPRFSFYVTGSTNLERLVAFIALSLGGTVLMERLHFLLQRERLYNAIISTTPMLIVLTDGDGRILMFNRHCEQLSGYRQQEVLAKNDFPFIAEEWRDAVRQRFAALDAGALREPHEVPWRTRDGRLRTIEWRSVIIPQELRAKPFVLGIGVDVTDMRDAQLRLRQFERISAQCELASLIAHELHNPMQALTNVFSLLLDGKVTDGQWYEYLQMAEAQLQRMGEVSQRLTALRTADDQLAAAAPPPNAPPS